MEVAQLEVAWLLPLLEEQSEVTRVLQIMPHLLPRPTLRKVHMMEKMSSNKNLASLIFTKCTIKWVMSRWNFSFLGPK